MNEKGDCFEQGGTLQQDLKQQTEEILREVYKDGFKEETVILIEDNESAIKLSVGCVYFCGTHPMSCSVSLWKSAQTITK